MQQKQSKITSASPISQEVFLSQPVQTVKTDILINERL